MEVKTDYESDAAVVSLSGHLLATTADAARKALNDALENTDKLILDMKDVDFMASSGLRVVLEIMKKMSQKGGVFQIRNVNETVLEVLDMTGMTSFLNIV